MNKTESFNEWCLVELFGHTRLIGKVTEATLGGQSFLRVDVPEVNGNPAYTRYLGSGAIYSMTPIGEAEALLAVKHVHAPPPLTRWELPAPEPVPGGDDDQGELGF